MEDKQVIIDNEHLRLLSIFYYIMGGITCFYGLFPILHLIMGIAMIKLAPTAESASESSPEIVGWFMVIIASVIIVLGLTLGILQILTGTFLKKKNHRGFCLAVSVISCLMIPFGTILGIFSITVLNREFVKKIFAKA